MKQWALVTQVDRYEAPDVFVFEHRYLAEQKYEEILRESFEGEPFDWQEEYNDDDLSWIVEVR